MVTHLELHLKSPWFFGWLHGGVGFLDLPKCPLPHACPERALVGVALAAGGLPSEFSRVHPYDHVGCRRRLGASSGHSGVGGATLWFWWMKTSFVWGVDSLNICSKQWTIQQKNKIIGILTLFDDVHVFIETYVIYFCRLVFFWVWNLQKRREIVQVLALGE